ncbi:MAG: TIGR02281 family clan AA aspartic protease [Rhodobiaceae bacterium]|nr:TIGR02281 family clan AA aspartic protease [Rhodobiaceae bacterium]MCC0012779.1 TIGR02281 family clan AA aspartic protease [Rhodobiaceae bacterium]MCC0018336.1 TIGR02281 family clan AA aspartic protease [Rhodobiaceae bacterium]MCC0051129.1 TIGR02281 family clan AA aspartic protease [Rhodobiaceae bacterium]MCC0060194.1 TIGR02281 family clan AA aspartic protease [Rhodobiaceae bacterium]
MRASTIIALVIVVAGAAVLIFSHEAGMIGGISNDQFASIVAMVAILIWMGGGAFSGRLRTDMRNFMIWLGVAAMLVVGYTFRDELRPIWSRIAGELNPSRPQVSGEDVILRRSADGHFHARARVNGTEMELLVDTGASRVSLSQADAQAAGIDLSALRYTVPVQTANGEVFMAGTHLNAVMIDTITVNDVPAFVAPPGALSGSVLGVSFLGALSGYSVRGDTLTLSP